MNAKEVLEQIADLCDDELTMESDIAGSSVRAKMEVQDSQGNSFLIQVSYIDIDGDLDSVGAFEEDTDEDEDEF